MPVSCPPCPDTFRVWTHSPASTRRPAPGSRPPSAEPTPAQELGWPAIADGAHTLIHAPTGSGKTLAAFLWTLDRLLSEPQPERHARCRVLYISPLKALAHDVERNLRAPLAGIRHASQRLETDPLPDLETFLRTGDTPAEDRRRMQRQPPDILITTPESLYLILTSAARAILEPVRWVIVDEVHAMAGTKRGAHLALSLERLEEITATAPAADRSLRNSTPAGHDRPVSRRGNRRRTTAGHRAR